MLRIIEIKIKMRTMEVKTAYNASRNWKFFVIKVQNNKFGYNKNRNNKFGYKNTWKKIGKGRWYNYHSKKKAKEIAIPS